MPSIDFNSELADNYERSRRILEKRGATIPTRPPMNAYEAEVGHAVNAHIRRTVHSHPGSAEPQAAPPTPEDTPHCERCQATQDLTLVRSIWPDRGQPLRFYRCRAGCTAPEHP